MGEYTCIYDVHDEQACSVWCRHYPGNGANDCVCPFAERQDVADNGPGPFVTSEPARRPAQLGARPGIDYTMGEPGREPLRPKLRGDAAPQEPPSTPPPGHPDANTGLGSHVPAPPMVAPPRIIATWEETVLPDDAPCGEACDGPGGLDACGDCPTPSQPVGEFGRAATRTLAEVRETFDARGNTYGDTWAVDDWLREWPRLRDCRALIRVKMRRAEMTGYGHRDSLVDLIAYAAAYVTWADEMEAWS